MTKHICLFGGPGTSKSTTAAGIFNRMKTNHLKVEYLTEYAKSLIYSNSNFRITDQLYILSKQHHPWYVLEDQVDYTINDGPFLLGLVYLRDLPHLPAKEFENLVVAMYKSYNTINIFLERNVEYHQYQEYGRSQSLSESLIIDDKIKELFKKYNIPFQTIKVSENTIDEVLKIIGNYYDN